MKSIYSIIILLLGISQVMYSQPVKLWQTFEFVKSTNIAPPTIAQDRHGNTYMLTNQTDANPLGGYSLVKYDTTGQMRWNKNYPPQGIFAGILYGSFTLDADGNSYLGVCFDGGLPSFDADATLIKYSPDGEKKWEQNYDLDRPGDSYIWYSALDTLQGRLITLGENAHETDVEGNFLFVQAIDTSDGHIIWRTELPGFYYTHNLRIQEQHLQILTSGFQVGEQYFLNLIVGFDGSILHEYRKPYTGYVLDFNYISKTGDVVFGNRGEGYHVTRVNVEGDTMWHYEYPDYSMKRWVRGVTEDADLNVYATGGVDVPDQYLEMVTTKFNYSGEIQWQQVYQSKDGYYIDTGNEIIENLGLTVVAGASGDAENEEYGIINIYDSSDGHLEYSITFTNDNIHFINKALLKGSKVYYTGISPALQNNVVVTGCIQLPTVNSGTIPSNESVTVTGYPNPAASFFSIKGIDLLQFEKLSIFDLQGRLVMEKKIERTEETIATSDWPSGTYVVNLSGQKVVLSKKMIKQ